MDDISELHPPYPIGTHIWVKEPFRFDFVDNARLDASLDVTVDYTHDGWFEKRTLTKPEWRKLIQWKQPYKGKSSLFMFKSLTRLWLDVTDVRVERLQDIAVPQIRVKDIQAEGVQLSREYIQSHMMPHFGVTSDRGLYKGAFIRLWDSINKDRAPWDSNPWVWAYTFKRIDK